MHRLSTLPILAALLALPMIAHAQDVTPTATPDPTNGWPVVERCVTDVREPDADWTFEGTIITFRPGDGVHAFRADVPTRYYLAFDNRREFGSQGVFSPDGQWFAVTRGDPSRLHWGTYADYRNIQTRIISVINGGEYAILASENSEGVSRIVDYIGYNIWVSPTQFVYGDRSYYNNENVRTDYSLLRFDVVENETHTDQREPFTNMNVLYDMQTGISLLGTWLEPSVNVNVIHSEHHYDVQFNESLQLLVADAESENLINTCIQSTRYAAVAISPDGTQIALPIGGEDGFVYIFDIEEWALYRLNLAANNVVAWLPEPT